MERLSIRSEKEIAMRFMIMVKATAMSESGAKPDDQVFAQMASYHEELAKAGVLLDATGLQPSSKGWRHSLFGRQAHRHRRPVRGNEGAGGGLHADPGAHARGSDRMGAALSGALRRNGRRRDRSAAAFRTRGLRA